MLSSAARARLTVVLVGARNPSNIGAAARAMQDFGFSDLRLVNEFAGPFEAAQLESDILAPPKSAVGAAAVMQRARRFDALPEAIGDCGLVIGTTAIGSRDLEHEVLTLQQAAPKIVEAMSSVDEHAPRVALMFGSEKTGLTNEQLSFCSHLLTIPLFDPIAGAGATRHLSMNLGQSVAVCLYELTREGFEYSRELPVRGELPATNDERERLMQLLLDLMQASGYTRRFPGNSRETVVRKLVQQLGSSRGEAETWMGLLRTVLRGITVSQPDDL